MKKNSFFNQFNIGKSILKESVEAIKKEFNEELKSSFDKNDDSNSYKKQKSNDDSKNEYRSINKERVVDNNSTKNKKNIIIIGLIIFVLITGIIVICNLGNTEHTDLIINQIENTEKSIEKGNKYTFKYDEYTTYVATAISDTTIKLEKWNEEKLKNELGIFKINDTANGFNWADNDKKLSFRFNFLGKINSEQNRYNLRYFTIDTNSQGKNLGTNYNDSIKTYAYNRDSNYYYRAIMLNDDIMKIECWEKGFLLFADSFNHDCRLVNVTNITNEFEWIDDDMNSFLITMKDEKNSNWNWNKDENVLFEIENKSYKFGSVIDYINKNEYVRNNNESNKNKENTNSNYNDQTDELLPIELVKNGTSYKRFYIEVAKAAIVYTISNYNNLDAFNDDGFTFDMSKMKPFGEKTNYSFSVFDEGKLEVIDSNTVRFDNLVLKPDNESSGLKYQAIKAKVTKKDDLYIISDLSYLILSGSEWNKKDEDFYGWSKITEDVCPMMVVNESMLQNVKITYKNSTAVNVGNTPNDVGETQETTKKRNIFDEPEVKMDRFIDTICRQAYSYGYQYSNLSVVEISDNVLDGKCDLRIKNKSGAWKNCKLHCVADFNKEKLITWDVK